MFHDCCDHLHPMARTVADVCCVDGNCVGDGDVVVVLDIAVAVAVAVGAVEAKPHILWVLHCS